MSDVTKGSFFANVLFDCHQVECPPHSALQASGGRTSHPEKELLGRKVRGGFYMFGDYSRLYYARLSCASGTQSISKDKIHQTYNRNVEV